MDLTGILIVLGVILVSMVLHELAHGVVAYWLGDDTAKEDGRLTLNPLKHLDPVMSVAVPLLLFIAGGPVFGGAKPVPINTRNLKGGAWGMALVAVAGPLTNFILAFGGFVIAHIVGAFEVVNGGIYVHDLAGQIFGQFVMVNIGFGIFNMLPIPPLDGSRVVYALAPDGVRRVMDLMERYGMIVVLILVMFGGTLLSKIMIGGMNGVLSFFTWIVGG